ncbi:hypothetical protein [Haloferax sp. YSMS24]|uniref:hypothetical protein n=1 Tax=unclassified Haloferax TaxID=2625095 RepID=UPI00398CB10E
MQTRSIGLVVTLLGLLGGVLTAANQFLPTLLNRHPGAIGLSGAPTSSSIGLLVAATSVLSFVLSPVLLFLVGYWAAGRADVPSEFATLAAVFGVAGGVTTFVGYLPVVAFLTPVTGTEPTFVLSALYTSVVRGVDYAVTGLAGAAVAHFRRDY